MERAPVDLHPVPALLHPPLLVGWQTHDVGMLASSVIHFLNEKMKGRPIAELPSLGFHSFGGVRFKGNVVQIPLSQFWACERKNLLLFKSDEPEFEHYRFLNMVLEWTESHFHAKEICTINGTVSFIPHTRPRRILVVFNRKEVHESVQGYDVTPLTWEGPPALSSYLLWVAQRKGIPGLSLWVEVPFYLAASEDPMAIKKVLAFLDKRFELGLDLSEIDQRILSQQEILDRLRGKDREIDDAIRRLENGEMPSEEEQLRLTQEVSQHISEKT